MRLIDADYVKRGNPWKDDVLRAVREAPTINAIPVDWLIKWAAEHTEYGTITVEKIIEDWENDKTNRKERNF